MLVAVLSLLIFASALLTVRAEQEGVRRQVYFFKPLTVVLIILIALQTNHATAPHYKQFIVAGLLCSLAGDVFLMLPRDRFVAGLVSFLFAHLFYVAAFMLGGGQMFSVWGAAALALYGALMLRLLWPQLGRLKAPVVFYVAAILLMAWQALNRWLAVGDAGSALALLGALLFVASDSALAWNRFRVGFKSAQAVILGTYFVAQWLIALST
ncbi:MAG TPA: lysoplasmalogenase [Pyrinomonadaceae bacterium]|nr:lysoplasmalogenase [Pyrinomonadaceae bacterium]